MGELHEAKYVAPDGMTATLTMEAGTDRVPPPKIDFYDHALDLRVTFYLAGVA